jgi:hypothetical protein
MDCRASNAVSRSALPDKSKKLSELSDPALQVGETVHYLRHANFSRWDPEES